MLGLDLDEWFRGHRDWRTLLDLVDELPRGSHYRAEIADDDEIAEAVATLKVQGTSRPPLKDWTAELEALTGIQDLLSALIYRGSGKQPPRLPRPETAFDRVDRKRVAISHAKVLGQLLPHS